MADEIQRQTMAGCNMDAVDARCKLSPRMQQKLIASNGSNKSLCLIQSITTFDCNVYLGNCFDD